MDDTTSITATARRLIEHRVMCDHCLGRQFAMLGTGMENGTRGWLLRNTVLIGAHARVRESGTREDISLISNQASAGVPLARSLCSALGLHADAGPAPCPVEPAGTGILETGECTACGGLFSSATRDALVDRIVSATSKLDFSSFLIGSKFSSKALEREETTRVELDVKWGEALKSHLNRFVGKALVENTGIPVNFNAPDIVILLTPSAPDGCDVAIEVSVNPYFFYGTYKKLVRGIPQTHWPHRACRGKGCEACDHTGKQYQESVEELIAGPVLAATGGTAVKFHGAGREDIDALMLGSGRPFVVEVLNGKNRAVDFEALARAINEQATGKVEVHDLRQSTKEEMQALKSDASETRKQYRATCLLEGPVSVETLASIKTVLESTPIKQRTPVRVAHRRADKVRTKHVHAVSWEFVPDNPLHVVLLITAEGGTYIKELISSDGGRTEPSVTSLAGQQVTCVELDVLDVAREEPRPPARGRHY